MLGFPKQEKLLEEDFDEASHDKVMSDMFGEDYYAINDCDEEKPVFDDDDDIDVIRKLRWITFAVSPNCDVIISFTLVKQEVTHFGKYASLLVPSH